MAQTTIVQTQAARQSLGGFGVFLLLMRAYSMGAGTYTGIEAVSNSLPILREPRVQTAQDGQWATWPHPLPSWRRA